MQEVADWRAQGKSEAKQLGFKPNKKAVLHPLNQSPDVAKDPRSMNQAIQWDAPRANQVQKGSRLSLVVDIMEGRRIGMEELEAGMSTYVALKLEVLKSKQARSKTILQVDDSKEAMYSMFADSRGSAHCRWIDNFHMSAFPIDSGLVTDKPYLRLTIKHGTLEASEFARHPSVVFEACTSKEIRVNLTLVLANTLGLDKLEAVVLNPTWYQWRTTRGANDDAFIKITAQLVETAKIPSIKDFLPYTEWPPMVLHTKKSRLDLMIEEQEAPEEERFEGKLGDQLISYNPASLPRILGVFAGDYNRDFLLAFGLVMGAPLIDRTGTLAVAKYDFAPDPVDPERRFTNLDNHDHP